MGENMTINLINYALAKKHWEKAYEDLKVLEIGGRNLIRNSDFSNGMNDWTFSSFAELTSEGALLESTVGNVVSIQPDTLIPPGKYIVQIWYKHLEGHTPYLFAINGTDMSYTGGYAIFEATQEGEEPQWKVATTEITVHSESPFFAIRYAGSSPVDHTEGKTLIKRMKIEKGNKATDWTPAPEDINAHPFVAELAETVYRSKQNEERIRNLENALTALGGGS